MLAKADVMKAVNKKRTEKIIPLEPVQTKDGKGGYTTVWTPHTASMMQDRKPNYKTETVGGAVSSVLTRELDIMYRTDIKKGWRVTCGVKMYSVDDVYSYDKESTILVCREVVK